MIDHELTFLDVRVLIKICAHDRMSIAKSGQGCLVSSKNIALALGVHQTSVSTAISRLKERGYIREEKRAEDKRGRTYRVLYTEADELAVRNEGNSPKSSLPSGETIEAKSFLENGKVVSLDFENDDNFQIDANYQYKEEEHSEKSGKNSEKSARLKRGINFESKAETAECLRRLEIDLVSSSMGWPDDHLDAVEEWLLETYEYYCNVDNSIAQWANRLHDQICIIIEERENPFPLAAPF